MKGKLTGLHQMVLPPCAFMWSPSAFNEKEVSVKDRLQVSIRIVNRSRKAMYHEYPCNTFLNECIPGGGLLSQKGTLPRRLNVHSEANKQDVHCRSRQGQHTPMR